jgi:DivIVA domain-containing protein
VQREHEVESANTEDVADQPAPADQLAPADWATADEIRRKRFTTVSDGFDPEEVKSYLDKLAEWFTHLARLRSGPVVVPDAPAQAGSEAASELATRMADVLREAEGHAGRIREEAEGEAKLLLAGAQEQAEHDAQQLLAEAKENADRTLAQAREQSNRAVAEAQEHAKRLTAEARDKAQRTGGEATLMLRDAERKVVEAMAMRDALLTEMKAAWERISAIANGMDAKSAPAAAPQQPVGSDAPPVPAEAPTGDEPVAAG